MDLEHQGITTNNKLAQDDKLNLATDPGSSGFDDSEDGLRVLARLIARVHIRNKLSKMERQDIDEENNNDSSNPFYSRTK